MNLHDRAVVTELDPHGMLGLTERFPAQCREAFEIACRVDPPKLENCPGVVVLAGMGGSAAGGDFISALFEAHGSAPFVVVRDYHLPHYVGVGDLVFCASYSGNTEETLSVYGEAKKAGARIVAITSGGSLKQMAEEDGFPVYAVPGGQPPRTALGYMLIPAIVACQRLKLIPEQDVEAAASRLDECARAWAPEAKDNAPALLAQVLHGSVPILYGLGTWEGYIAYRWRCQINENAKQLAFANAFPELDHNEILGWVNAAKQGVSRFEVVVLEGGGDNPRMLTRAAVTERLASPTRFQRVQATGESLLEKMLTLTYFGDFVSLYLARLNEVDPENIDAIDILKKELSALKPGT